MSNQNTAVQLLKQTAAKDPVLNAVLHMWALRRRARNEVTIHSLAAKMKAEGFIHSKTQYEPVLKLMSQLGFGQLQTNSRGHVVALKDIKTTLQSIGRAVCDPNHEGVLKTYRKKNKFRDLSLSRSIPPVSTPVVKTQAPASSVAIIATIEGKSVTIPIDGHLTDEELLYLINCFKKMAS